MKTRNGAERHSLRLSCAEQILGERSLDDKLSLVRAARFDGLPGEGSIDFIPLLAALLRQAYAGWLGFETRPVQDLAALDRAVQHVRTLWSRVVSDDEV